MIETYGTHKVPEEKIAMAVRELFDMRPGSIIKRLDLLRPIYAPTAAYGHFGRVDKNSFTWEDLNYLEKLKELTL